MLYDGVGRATTTYTTDGGGDSGWADANDVTGDIVLSHVPGQIVVAFVAKLRL